MGVLYCTESGKVISERLIEFSDTQILRHMFLISPASNIMVEEFTAAAISCYQRLTLVRRGGGYGFKTTGDAKREE